MVDAVQVMSERVCEGFIGGFVTCADSGVRSAALTVVLGVNANAPLTANAISLFLPLHNFEMDDMVLRSAYFCLRGCVKLGSQEAGFAQPFI